MNKYFFYEIFRLNILKDTCLNDIEKKYIINDAYKITNIKNKFLYYKKINNNYNENIVNVFYKSQKLYWIIYLFIIKKKYINAIVYNDFDLIYNKIDNKETFNILIDKFIYQFAYNDFIKIIINNLFNYKLYTSELDIYLSRSNSNFLVNPLEIKNPYTNIIFNKNILYNFYFFCKQKNLHIPIILHLYYKCNFNINKLFLLHENYLTINSVKKYIISLSNDEKYNYLLKSVLILDQFILTYFDTLSIKYLSADFKEKIYNMNLNLIDNNFDYIIYNYFMYLYNFKIHNFKNKTKYKLKLIKNLINNKQIKFVEKNNKITNLYTNDILDIIKNLYDHIYIKEINSSIIISYYNINNEIHNEIHNEINQENNTYQDEEDISYNSINDQSLNCEITKKINETNENKLIILSKILININIFLFNLYLLVSIIII
tara:strand:- start:3576 stop:4868 length:1293 start_codon:yes stop_codon:yes gene_type:complete